MTPSLRFILKGMGGSEGQVVAAQEKSRSATLSRNLAWAATVGLAFLATVEARQYDALTALSAFPRWCWWLGASLLAAFALVRCSRRTRLVVFAMLLLIGMNWVEQFPSFTRSTLDLIDADQPRPWLRVVSLNCAAGSCLAAEEAAANDPDLILLQESPGKEVLAESAAKLFGEQAAVLATSDCSIVARGTLRLIREEWHFLYAILDRADGRSVHVVCVRLLPPIVRYDLWAPSCWREYREARVRRRAEAHEIARVLSEIPDGELIVLGGDCNAPGSDGALREWAPKLQDAFDLAGRGWGATVLNRVPVHRFDQVWSSSTLVPQRVIALQSDYSDHRMVVADFAAAEDISRPNAEPAKSRDIP